MEPLSALLITIASFFLSDERAILSFLGILPLVVSGLSALGVVVSSLRLP